MRLSDDPENDLRLKIYVGLWVAFSIFTVWSFVK